MTWPREVLFYRSSDERGSRALTLTIIHDGSMRIGGQDLGPGVSEAFGAGLREYEWDWTVLAPDVARAVDLLGGQPDDDHIAVLRRWAAANAGRDPGQFLKESGLHLGFWSRIGE